jgi:hypothetical protein
MATAHTNNNPARRRTTEAARDAFNETLRDGAGS